jgi:hypothetical protein
MTNLLKNINYKGLKLPNISIPIISSKNINPKINSFYQCKFNSNISTSKTRLSHSIHSISSTSSTSSSKLFKPIVNTYTFPRLNHNNSEEQDHKNKKSTQQDQPKIPRQKSDDDLTDLFLIWIILLMLWNPEFW